MPIQTQVNLANLPPWYEALSRQNLERANQFSRAPYAPYQGQRIAQSNPDLQRAQELGRQEQLYMPYLNQAQQNYGRASQSFPQNVDQYMNPYLQHVVNKISQEGLRTFNEGVLPSLQGQFIGMGQMGSSLHQDLAHRAARDAQQNILSQQQQALAQGYGQAANIHQQDMNRQLQSGQALAEMGRQRQSGHFSDIGALYAQGEHARDINQQGLNVGYQNFLRQEEYPWRQIGNFSGAMAGTPYSSMEVSHSQLPQPPQRREQGWGSQLFNLAGQLGGAAISSGAFRKAGGQIRKQKPKNVQGLGSLKMRKKPSMNRGGYQ